MIGALFFILLFMLPEHTYAHGSTLASGVSLIVRNLLMYLALLLASLAFSSKGNRLASFIIVAVLYPFAFLFLVPIIANLVFSGDYSDKAWEIGMYIIFALTLFGMLYFKYIR